MSPKKFPELTCNDSVQIGRLHDILIIQFTVIIIIHECLQLFPEFVLNMLIFGNIVSCSYYGVRCCVKPSQDEQHRLGYNRRVFQSCQCIWKRRLLKLIHNHTRISSNLITLLMTSIRFSLESAIPFLTLLLLHKVEHLLYLWMRLLSTSRCPSSSSCGCLRASNIKSTKSPLRGPCILLSNVCSMISMKYLKFAGLKLIPNHLQKLGNMIKNMTLIRRDLSLLNNALALSENLTFSSRRELISMPKAHEPITSRVNLDVVSTRLIRNCSSREASLTFARRLAFSSTKLYIDFILPEVKVGVKSDRIPFQWVPLAFVSISSIIGSLKTIVRRSTK